MEIIDSLMIDRFQCATMVPGLERIRGFVMFHFLRFRVHLSSANTGIVFFVSWLVEIMQQ